MWTMHFGFDNSGWSSFERAAKLINDTGKPIDLVYQISTFDRMIV